MATFKKKNVTKKKRIYVIIAAFNEEKKLPKVLGEVTKYADTVVVVDDGSRDRTYECIKGKNVVALKHIINLGQGAALQTGFDYAKKMGADVVVTYDADGQFKASEISKMVAPILSGKADATLGSRFIGKTVNMPFVRFLVLRFGLLFTTIFSNIRLTDTHNGFRAFSKYAIDKMEIIHNRWAHPSDIIYQVAKNDFKIIEVPVTVYYTDYSKHKGQSNMEAFKIPVELVKKALFGI